MERTIIHKNSLLMILHFLLFGHLLIFVSNSNIKWDFNKGGQDWPATCQSGDQAPIDVSKPFEFRKFNISFSYSNMMTEYLFLNDGNNLILEGDFGYLEYEGITYFSSQILFYSPSLHTFSNNRMPFEMQVIHKDEKGNEISVSVLYQFSKSDYSIFLAKLGFDDEKLKDQKAFMPQVIKEEIDLSKYISSSKDFYIYNSTLFLPPCDKSSLNFILTDVMKISEKQIKNFPILVLNKNKIVQQRGERKIFTTFKIEEVEKKLALKQKLLLKKQKEKDEFEKLKKLSEGKSVTNTITGNTETVKSDSVKVEENVEKDMEKKLIDDCDKKNIISVDDVKEKVKALEKSIKASDPKLISSISSNKTEILEIDKEIPDSEFSRERKELNEKFKEYLKLYNESLKSTENKSALFVQMKLLETYFIEKNYKPFLNFIEIKKKQNKSIETSNRSFLQLEKLNEINTESLVQKMENNLFLGKPINFFDEIKNDDYKLLNENLNSTKRQDLRNKNIKNEIYNLNPIKLIKDNFLNKTNGNFSFVSSEQSYFPLEEEDLFLGVNEIHKFFGLKEALNKSDIKEDKILPINFIQKSELKSCKPILDLTKGGYNYNLLTKLLRKRFVKRKDNPFGSDVIMGNGVNENLNKLKDSIDMDIYLDTNSKPSDNKKNDKYKRYYLKSKDSFENENDEEYEEFLPQVDNFEESKLNQYNSRKKNNYSGRKYLRINHKIEKFIDALYNNDNEHNIEYEKLRNIHKYNSKKKKEVNSLITSKKIFSKTLKKINKSTKKNHFINSVISANMKNSSKRINIPLKKEINVNKTNFNDSLIQEGKRINSKVFDIINKSLKEALTNSFTKSIKNNTKDLPNNIEIQVLHAIAPSNETNTFKSNDIIKKLKNEKKNSSENYDINTIKNLTTNKTDSRKVEEFKKLDEYKKIVPETNDDLKLSIEFNKSDIDNFDIKNANKTIDISGNQNLIKNSSEIESGKLFDLIKPKNLTDEPKTLRFNIEEIFNFINIILNNMIDEIRKLDEINKRVYDSQDTILFEGSFIKLTREAFSNIIYITQALKTKKFFKSEKIESMIAKKIFLRIFIEEYKNKETDNFKEIKPSNISSLDINEILKKSNLLLKKENPPNDKSFDIKDLESLVKKILEISPVILYDEEIPLKDSNSNINNDTPSITYFDLTDFKDKYEKSNLKDETNEKKNLREFLIDYFLSDVGRQSSKSDDSEKSKIFLNRKEKNLRVFDHKNKDKSIIYGVPIQEKLGDALISIPGKGRKPINQRGEVDSTPIFDVNLWPESCKKGFQSPINIKKPYEKTDKELVINLNTLKGTSTIENDGYKLIFSNDSIGLVKYDSIEYKAKRIELHNPSEHTLGDNETRSPMEMQIICESDDGKNLAIAVLFEFDLNDNEILTIMGLGVENPLIGLKLRNNESVLVNHDNIKYSIDLGKYLNSKKKYYSYTGSLTTPPCTQNVIWIILVEKLKTSRSQVNYFPILFGRKSNVRGLQTIQERKIYEN